MAKARVSEVEKKRNVLPGSSESFDLVILKEYLNGRSIEALSNDRFIAKGQVDLRIKMTLKAITAFLDEKVPDKYYSSPLSYKNYWLNSVQQYQLLEVIRNPASQFSVFLIYFKNCSQAERLRMFGELETYVYD